MALTANKLPRFKGVTGGNNQVQDSGVSDDGSAIALARNTDITGDLDVSSTIKGAAGMTLAGTIVGVTTAITGTKNNALAISVPNQTADAAGVGISITADAGAVGARNGGNITLTPGAKSGGGTDGVVSVVGNLNVSGNVTSGTAAKGLVLKRGANGLCGTFVANGTTPVDVASTSVAVTDCIIISLNTVGGTVGVQPHVATITAATGFSVVCTASDTSTYNWCIIKNAA